MAVYSVPKVGIEWEIPRVVHDSPRPWVRLCHVTLCVVCYLCDSLGNSKMDCRIVY